LFRDDPISLSARRISSDERFREVEEAVSVEMLFPKARLASFICSFGAFDSSYYQVVGTNGRIRLENAYEYTEAMKLLLDSEKQSKTFMFPKQDQFGAEIEYLSDCIIQNRVPEPSGVEGLTDLHIIEAIEKSAQSKHSVSLWSLP